MKQDNNKRTITGVKGFCDNELTHEIPADRSFSIRIGGTEYLVSTHMKTEGKRTVLDQFKQMLIQSGLV
ncbi:MAG: hypothetical protein K6G56_08225 [Clostridiales bacterium]|nr:hypothetical protein [Clostridiales bacterium]